MTIAASTLGIDVSKQWLDCYLHPIGRRFRFSNDDEGHGALVALSCAQDSFCVLEATGPYDRALRNRLHEARRPFHMANPRKARQFAKAAGFLAKTDRVDAMMLARYGVVLDLPAQDKPEPGRQALRDLMARRDQLVEMRKAETIRLQQAPDELEESFVEMIGAIERLIAAVERRLEALIRSSASLRAQEAILRSAPGIGPVTARILLAHMPELGHRDRRAISALAGLAPLSCDSGTMAGKRRIWGGRKRVRDALYMAALAACRTGPFKAAYMDLRERGKPCKLAIIAIARRLLVALNAAIRDKRTFQT